MRPNRNSELVEACSSYTIKKKDFQEMLDQHGKAFAFTSKEMVIFMRCSINMEKHSHSHSKDSGADGDLHD